MPDGPESRCGMHIFLCLICRERRRVPGITGRIVAVRCGRGVWCCVFAGRFLLSFGGLLKYSVSKSQAVCFAAQDGGCRVKPAQQHVPETTTPPTPKSTSTLLPLHPLKILSWRPQGAGVRSVDIVSVRSFRSPTETDITVLSFGLANRGRTLICTQFRTASKVAKKTRCAFPLAETRR